jgi:hypothetical protein
MTAGRRRRHYLCTGGCRALNKREMLSLCVIIGMRNAERPRAASLSPRGLSYVGGRRGKDSRQPPGERWYAWCAPGRRRFGVGRTGAAGKRLPAGVSPQTLRPRSCAGPVPEAATLPVGAGAGGRRRRGIARRSEAEGGAAGRGDRSDGPGRVHAPRKAPTTG